MVPMAVRLSVVLLASVGQFLDFLVIATTFSEPSDVTVTFTRSHEQQPCCAPRFSDDAAIIMKAAVVEHVKI